MPRQSVLINIHKVMSRKSVHAPLAKWTYAHVLSHRILLSYAFDEVNLSVCSIRSYVYVENTRSVIFHIDFK